MLKRLKLLISIALALVAFQPMLAMEAPIDWQGRLNAILIGTIRRTQAPSTQEVQKWIDAGADVNTVHPLYGTPLTIAARNGHREICLLLLRAGANEVSAQKKLDASLIQAIYDGNIEDVKECIAKGAQVNAREEYCPKATALEIAANFANEQIFDLLFKHGADINAKDSMGNSNLHRAIMSGCPTVCTMFLRLGANLNARNNDGDTPLLACARRNGFIPNCKFLIENGADVNYQDRNGATALMLIIQKANNEYTAGINYMATDNPHGSWIKQTIKGYVSLCELLLKYGAQTKLKDKNGLTALDYAQRSNEALRGFIADACGVRLVPGDCNICLDALVAQGVSIDPCGHYFHPACIKQWCSAARQNSQTCPNCRGEIKGLINP